MNEEQIIQEIKLAALNRFSELGFTPDDVGSMIKAAVRSPVKQANLLSFIPQTAAVARNTAAWALMLSGGLGLGAGYAGEKIFGENEQDVIAARLKRQTDDLRRATIRMNAESSVGRENEDDKQRRKPPALEILSAV